MAKIWKKVFFLCYNIEERSENMYFYSGKLSCGRYTDTDRFIFVNDFGYCEDYDKMFTYRENGRLDYQLIYVKQGTLTIHEKNKKLKLTSGDICLFRPNEPQIYTIDGENTTHYWILFTGSEVEKMLAFFKERSYHIGAFPEFEHFCHSLWSDIQDDQESSELLLDGMLLTIIARTAQSVNQDNKRNAELFKLRRAIEIMKSECHIQRSNEELASLCDLSKFYFIKLFKKSTGFAPHEYYTKLIMDKSSNLLLNTNYSVNEIAKLCGIEDALYFSKKFKKHMGMSPRAYRSHNPFLTQK